MIFAISTAGLNVVLTGMIALSSNLGMGDALNSFLPETKKVETSVVQPVRSDTGIIKDQSPVMSDPAVKMTFERPIVITIAAPPPPPPPPVNPLIAVSSVDPESQISKNFDVLATIEAAKSEIGKSFPVGWNNPGECLVAAKRWVTAGKGNWYGAGTPIGNYAGAKVVDYKNAAPGDVIQYLSPSNPESWAAGVHTLLVVGNNEDGTLDIIEANNPGGSGFVSENKKWTPKPPNGLEYKVFRF